MQIMHSKPAILIHSNFHILETSVWGARGPSLRECGSSVEGHVLPGLTDGYYGPERLYLINCATKIAKICTMHDKKSNTGRKLGTGCAHSKIARVRAYYLYCIMWLAPAD